jgi:catechol 2,3-dioxygenase-like lactoylglutathione lyase family enzyme
MLPSRLSAVTLVTDDVMARRGFYEALGWRTPLAPRDDYARLQTAGAALSIWTAHEARDEIAEPLRRAGFEFPGFTLAVAVERDELVDEGIEAARAAGASVVGEAEMRPFGGRSAYFADPAGIPWEIVCIPNTRIDEGGVLRYD